jgi:N-acetylglucosamine-6-sulfatase
MWKSELEKETFAVRLQQAGYVTFYAGKYLNEYGANKVSEELIQIKYFQICF